MVFKLSKTLRLIVFVIVMEIISTSNSKVASRARQQVTFYSSYMDTTICRTIPGLTKAQIELCYRQPDATLAAIQGLAEAVDECQYQFQGQRWNCSTLSTKGKNPYVSAILQKGYQETAFAHAITSAGIAISVARSCSAGLITNCGCDNKIYKIRKPRSMPNALDKTQWKWGGCSHNVKYGIRFSKWFLDSRNKAQDLQSKISLHNNQVGRLTVKNNMQVKCKCHGMSGSCELKTCWRAVPDFRIVGRMLKDKYKQAILVDQTNLGKKHRRFNVNQPNKRRNTSRLKQWTPRKNKNKRNLSTDLLFYQKSPNFCEKDAHLDIQGTSGRFCNKTSIGSDSCENLCCGRGHNYIKKKKVERCNCKFVWCCQVECDTCIYEEWISVCK